MKMVKDKKLVVGADFAGYPLKEAVCAHLRAKGWEITDMGVKADSDPNDTDLMFHRVGLRVGAMISEGEFERALLRMKFDKVYSKVIAFSELMTVQFEKMNVKCDFIVPVPTVMMNYIIRDYCTSCELSYKIAKKCFMKVYDDMLIKKKNIQQSALKFEQRYTNVFGMYVFNSKYKDFLKGKSVLLVDDVITSGATVSECAKVLKENGAARVYAVALLYGGDRIL